MQQVGLDLTKEGIPWGIASDAVFQRLFGDGGEALYQEVIDSGFIRLGRELTGAEAGLIHDNIKAAYGADK